MQLFASGQSLIARKHPIFGCTIHKLGPTPPGNLVEASKVDVSAKNSTRLHAIIYDQVLGLGKLEFKLTVSTSLFLGVFCPDYGLIYFFNIFESKSRPKHYKGFHYKGFQ